EKHESFISRACRIESVLPKPNGPVRGSRLRSCQPRHIRTRKMEYDSRNGSDEQTFQEMLGEGRKTIPAAAGRSEGGTGHQCLELLRQQTHRTTQPTDSASPLQSRGPSLAESISDKVLGAGRTVNALS